MRCFPYDKKSFSAIQKFSCLLGATELSSIPPSTGVGCMPKNCREFWVGRISFGETIETHMTRNVIKDRRSLSASGRCLHSIDGRELSHLKSWRESSAGGANEPMLILAARRGSSCACRHEGRRRRGGEAFFFSRLIRYGCLRTRNRSAIRRQPHGFSSVSTRNDWGEFSRRPLVRDPHIVPDDAILRPVRTIGVVAARRRRPRRRCSETDRVRVASLF